MPRSLLLTALSLAACFLTALPLTAAAQECIDHVRSTEQALATVKERAEGVAPEKRARIQVFIDDAIKMLDQARADCERAQSPFDQTVAIAKVLVSQGNLSAAHLLIRAE